MIKEQSRRFDVSRGEEAVDDIRDCYVTLISQAENHTIKSMYADEAIKRGVFERPEDLAKYLASKEDKNFQA